MRVVDAGQQADAGQMRSTLFVATAALCRLHLADCLTLQRQPVCSALPARRLAWLQHW